MEATEIDIKLTVAQLNVVLSCLSEGKFSLVVDIINVIRTQAIPQLPKEKEPNKSDTPAPIYKNNPTV